MIFIQAVGQIKTLYKDDWETLMGASDVLVYLGGNELSSMEDLSKKLGDQTIRIRDSSTSRSGKGGSDSKSFKYSKRSLLTVDEIRRLKDGYCIVLVKGQDPFYDRKYRTPEHENAKYLGNFDTGLGLYTFSYCNTKPESIEKLEKKKRMLQENNIKHSEQTRQPDKKMYRGSSPVPSPNPMTAEQQAEIAKQVAAQTAVISFDTTAAVAAGATVKEVSRGVVTVTSAKPKPVVSAANSVKKPTVTPQITRSAESIMDDFGMIDT